MNEVEAEVLEEFLLKFLIEPELVIEHSIIGLCNNFGNYAGYQCSYSVLSDLVNHLYGTPYPINDKTSGLSADRQYDHTNLYEGNQLKLRKELALDILGKLENGTIPIEQ